MIFVTSDNQTFPLSHISECLLKLFKLFYGNVYRKIKNVNRQSLQEFESVVKS